MLLQEGVCYAQCSAFAWQNLFVFALLHSVLQGQTCLLSTNLLSTERPEALDKACFFIAGIDEKSLLQAVDCAVEMNNNHDDGIPVPDYVDENVSTKVVKIIQSYVGVVNKMVWRKF